MTKAPAAEMKNGKIRHGYKQDRVIEGEPRVDSFGMFWCNIPKNLFSGPRSDNAPFNRHDDPGEKFEENASVAVGKGLHGQLRGMHRDMVNYTKMTNNRTVPKKGIPTPWPNQNAKGLARRISRDYARLAVTGYFSPVKHTTWILHDLPGKKGKTLHDRYELKSP